MGNKYDVVIKSHPKDYYKLDLVVESLRSIFIDIDADVECATAVKEPPVGVIERVTSVAFKIAIFI